MSRNNESIIVQALKEKLDRLLEEIQQVKEALKNEGADVDHINVFDSQVQSEDLYPDYNPKFSLSKKFYYLLKVNKRFLHFREAAKIINRLEHTGFSDTELASKLSSGTQSLKSDKVIVKFQHDSNNKNSFWGSPSWLNDDGSIKKGHEFDESYLYKKNTSDLELF